MVGTIAGGTERSQAATLPRCSGGPLVGSCAYSDDYLFAANPAWLAPRSLSGLAMPQDTIATIPKKAVSEAEEPAAQNTIGWHRRCVRFTAVAVFPTTPIR